MSKVKYPRTPHFPFSLGATSDDKKIDNDSHFHGKKIVITEKMDGENVTLYNNEFHARSLDSDVKDYHSWLANYHAKLKHLIPDGVRLCGEYMFAEHSIHYTNLQSYFLLFNVFIDDVCDAWSGVANTAVFMKSMKVPMYTVPVMYVGQYDPATVEKIYKIVVNQGGEGIVVRNYDSFKYEDFSLNVAKAVRENHVQSDVHWSKKEIIKNELGWDR